MITKLENIIIKGIKYKSQYFLRIITIYFPTIILFPTEPILYPYVNLFCLFFLIRAFEFCASLMIIEYRLIIDASFKLENTMTK